MMYPILAQPSQKILEYSRLLYVTYCMGREGGGGGELETVEDFKELSHTV